MFFDILYPMTEPTPAAAEAPIYKDDDLVYVDPDARVVVGLVTFMPNGMPKKMQRPSTGSATEKVLGEDETPEKKPVAGKPVRRAPMRIRYYPWGTYRSMRKIYKLEGKQPREESPYTLDDVIEKALSQPFWD